MDWHDTPPMPQFRGPDGTMWVWDSTSHTYVKSEGNDFDHDRSHSFGGDANLFDVGSNWDGNYEKTQNPLQEGILASSFDELPEAYDRYGQRCPMCKHPALEYVGDPASQEAMAQCRHCGWQGECVSPDHPAREGDSAHEAANWAETPGKVVCPNCLKENEGEHCAYCGKDLTPEWNRHGDEPNPMNVPQQNTNPAPFYDRVVKPNHDHWDNSFPSMLSRAPAQLKNDVTARPEYFSHVAEELAWREANAPELGRCPECHSPLMEMNGEEICHSCGHRQPVITQKMAINIPAPFKNIQQNLTAGPGQGDAGTHAGIASSLDDIGGVMQKALAGGEEAAVGGLGALKALAAFGEDEVGRATKNRGEDSDPDAASETGIEGKPEHGDGPEQLKDVNGIGGAKTDADDRDDMGGDPDLQGKAVDAFHMNLPLIIEFAEDPTRSGSEHPILKALDELLELAFPGYKEGHDPEAAHDDEDVVAELHGDDEPEADGSEKKEFNPKDASVWHFAQLPLQPGQPMQPGQPGQMMQPGQIQPCPLCGYPHQPGTPCHEQSQDDQMAGGVPGYAGGQMPTMPGSAVQQKVVTKAAAFPEVLPPEGGALPAQPGLQDASFKCQHCGSPITDPSSEICPNCYQPVALNEQPAPSMGDPRDLGSGMHPLSKWTIVGDAFNNELDAPPGATPELQPDQPQEGKSGGSGEGGVPGMGGLMQKAMGGEALGGEGGAAAGAAAEGAGALAELAPLALLASADEHPYLECPNCGHGASYEETIARENEFHNADRKQMALKSDWDRCPNCGEQMYDPAEAAADEAHYRELEDEQAPGHYEMYGPDQTTWEDIQRMESRTTVSDADFLFHGAEEPVHHDHTQHEHEHHHLEEQGQDWLDEQGTPIEEGSEYEMISPNYAIPDRVTILHVTPEKLIFTIHSGDVDYQDEITKKDLANEGYQFRPADDLALDSESGFPEENADYPRNQDAINQVDDLTAPSTVVSKSREWLMEDSSPVEVDPETLRRITAGKDYDPREQREFIEETGTARNLAKLDLTGTHYVDDDEISVNFLW